MTDNTALTTTGSSSTVPQDDLHAEDALASLILVGILIIAALIAYLITHKRWTIYFPESGAAMILGIVIGGILRLLTLANFNHQLDFEPEKFYFILLPPIIFEAGYNMNKKNFFLNMTSILLFSVLGTLLSAFVVGFGLFGVTKAGMIKSLSSDHPMECLLFGALISATDPVATLSIMGSKELRVQPLLYSLIFGESVLNDAVAIVLFRTLSGFSTSSKGFQGIDLLKSMGTFVLVSLGSLGIGVGVGLISAFLFKRTKSMKEHPYMEVSLLALFAYSSYLASEWAGMSGVMSLFLCGVVMKHYNWYSLSSEAQTSTSHLFKTMSFVAETFVFVYLGTSLLHATDMKWDPALIAVSLLLILLGRAVNIFPISFLLNLRRKVKITIKMQVMLWFVGLRGAIAFALAMNLHPPLLPPVGVWTVSQFQCGWSSSQTSY
eukprot:TRINITY_DN4816_c0_g1_i2.p1 TRINITY_DN4816_c0_g1~~TRINITY_DN4816_c0_g1_i2.p1  ORF type:complete len:435 (+),score=79.12 TRINITY_DN4816_c0_g1_i2:167-1471(+)